MARKSIGVTTSSITWEPLKSEIDESETGEITITIVGQVDSRNTSADAARQLVPSSIPISSTGPIGNATAISGAKLATRSVRGDDCFWTVTATYKKSAATTADFGEDGQRSDNDRAERRIVVAEEPILSTAVARKFSNQQRNRLKGLMDGYIIANPDYGGEGETSEDEFLSEDPDTGKFTVPVEFADDSSSAGGVTASPLDYARMIKAGIVTCFRPTIRHVWSTSRNNPASSSDYQRVGKIVTSPNLAPSLAAGVQWMLTGVIDRTDNGDTWSTDYEYDASGAGGYLSALYAGGSAEI